MHSASKKTFISFLKILLPVTILCGVAQYLIINMLFEPSVFFLNTWSIYLFHLSVTLVILAALLAVAKVAYDKVGYAFMACSMFKMFFSILFLIPLIKSNQESKIGDIIAFFIPYFIFLGFDTYFTLRLLKLKKS